MNENSFKYSPFFFFYFYFYFLFFIPGNFVGVCRGFNKTKSCLFALHDILEEYCLLHFTTL